MIIVKNLLLQIRFYRKLLLIIFAHTYTKFKKQGMKNYYSAFF